MLPRHAEADALYPGTPSSAGNCSVGVDPSWSIFVEVALLQAVAGVQLGEKVVFDLSREDEHHRGLSLGSRIVMGRRHEEVGTTYVYRCPGES